MALSTPADQATGTDHSHTPGISGHPSRQGQVDAESPLERPLPQRANAQRKR